MGHEGDGDTNSNRCTRNNSRMISLEAGRTRNQRKSGVLPDYSIIKIGQNTEKGSGDLKRLAVTQTPVEDHQLMVVWKTKVYL